MSLFFSTAPNAPPSDVQGYITSPTSILVEWGNVPVADQNGIILRYTVKYTALPEGSEQTKVVNVPTTEATLMDLNEHTNYTIKVFASTVKGDGNVSEPITRRTGEDSEFSNCFKCCKFYVNCNLFTHGALGSSYELFDTCPCVPDRIGI